MVIRFEERGVKLSAEDEQRILAMPGVLVNGKPVPGPMQLPNAGKFRREKAFMAWIISVALDRGWESYHTHDSRRSEAGFPDLVMLREMRDEARLVVAELKMPGKKPTDAQMKWLRLFRLAGAETFTWYPYDLETIVKVLW
jgi:hypothetical protein